jgi:phosphorylcholine metabolism protein LicD
MTHNNFEDRDIANKENLSHIIKLINELDYFLFFGTLLGDIRENDVIKNDDDIDFLVNLNEIGLLENILINNGYSITVKEKFFISFYNININEAHTIDFYLYYLDGDNVIIPKSFYGNNALKLKRHYLILDINLFFPPLKNINGAKIPNKSKNIISILYGEKWNQKLIKNIQYFIYFKNNIPKVTYNLKLIKLLYFVRLISELRLTKARRLLLEEIGFYKLIKRTTFE